MPIYDYACTVCGRVVEVVHGINGQRPERLRDVRRRDEEAASSSPAIHFKGSGWAKKDSPLRTARRTKAAAHRLPQGGGGQQSRRRPETEPSNRRLDRASRRRREDRDRASSEARSRRATKPEAPAHDAEAPAATSDADARLSMPKPASDWITLARGVRASSPPPTSRSAATRSRAGPSRASSRASGPGA